MRKKYIICKFYVGYLYIYERAIKQNLFILKLRSTILPGAGAVYPVDTVADITMRVAEHYLRLKFKRNVVIDNLNPFLPCTF